MDTVRDHWRLNHKQPMTVNRPKTTNPPAIPRDWISRAFHRTARFPLSSSLFPLPSFLFLNLFDPIAITPSLPHSLTPSSHYSGILSHPDYHFDHWSVTEPVNASVQLSLLSLLPLHRSSSRPRDLIDSACHRISEATGAAVPPQIPAQTLPATGTSNSARISSLVAHPSSLIVHQTRCPLHHVGLLFRAATPSAVIIVNVLVVVLVA